MLVEDMVVGQRHMHCVVLGYMHWWCSTMVRDGGHEGRTYIDSVEYGLWLMVMQEVHALEI